MFCKLAYKKHRDAACTIFRWFLKAESSLQKNIIFYFNPYPANVEYRVSS